MAVIMHMVAAGPVPDDLLQAHSLHLPDWSPGSKQIIIIDQC